MKHKTGLRKHISQNIFFMSLIAFFIALAVSAVIIGLSGYNPFSAYAAIFGGAFGSLRAVTQTFTQATPLIFTGLAFALARQAGLINIGVEGQLQIGALFSVIIATLDLGLPKLVHVPLVLLAGMLGGALYAGLVAFMKVRFGSNEVISTIMLNTIATFFVDYMLNGPIGEPGSGVAQTKRVAESAELTKLFPKYQLTIAIFLAVILCVFIQYMMKRSVLGYRIRVIGLNNIAAETAGINYGKVVIMTMLMSGAIAGLAGACHVAGVDRRLISGFSPGYGFDGIAVSALASDIPVGVIFSGIVFGALRAGAMVLNRTAKVPTDFVAVIQALVVIFVAAPLLIRKLIRADKSGRSDKTTPLIDTAQGGAEEILQSGSLGEEETPAGESGQASEKASERDRAASEAERKEDK